ncbi:MAG: ATP-binding protein [Bacteroides sp.]|nr:ATP-binding protein [Bacteroides sp.]MCM1379711.1 ATP-binding protein [Bacteroides sp.]MCM1446066.1 ATP-binding protein [Prevotella sp.]
MAQIIRTITDRVDRKVIPGKATIIYGARRVGKTILLRDIIQRHADDAPMLLNGEDAMTVQMFANRTVANYRGLFGGTRLLAIDEAQNIPEIGKVLKLIVDEMPDLAVIATGSASFDLLQQVGEPLVGRASQFLLLPFSKEEISQIENPIQAMSSLPDRLIYGSYPDVVMQPNFAEKQDYLRDLASSYLLKDILAVDGIKNSAKMRQLLQFVACQVGSEVSTDELSRTLSMSKNTIERYLDLLSKVFVLYRLGGYSRNLRNEVVRTCKWYFYDNGVRNAVIGDFRPLEARQDVGALWENYLISELLKMNNNLAWHNRYYFWRTYQRKKIDLIEETEPGKLNAFEFKWGTKKPVMPEDFARGYPDATYTIVSRDNYYFEFLTPNS